MKKYLSIFSFVLAGLLAFTSCDDNATTIEFVAQEAEYTGEMEVSLYTPNSQIENQLMNLFGDCNICTKLVPAKVIMKSNEDPKISISALPDEGIDLNFEIKFLDDNYDVLDIYQTGMLASLYYNLRDAMDFGLLPKEKFYAFANEIKDIKDTLNIKGVSTDMLPMALHGVGYSTWDYEKNSMFTTFNMSEQTYTRKSNIFNAFAMIKDEILALYQQGFFTEDDIKSLRMLQTHQANKITDGSGRAAILYANYQIDAQLTIKNATGLLDAISAALFGYENYGDFSYLRNEVWLMLNIEATQNFGGRYERVD